MTRPLDMMKFPYTFTYEGVTYRELKANEYVRVEEDGSETPITKKSNQLMDALMAGEVVED